MKYIRLFIAVLTLSFAGTGVALADFRYDIQAIDDVNGDPTLFGSITTTAPFSLDYNFNVLDFNLHYLTEDVTYQKSNSTITVERQGFLFTANDSSFVLTLYPDSSYFSEYFVGEDVVNESGYFAFTEQVTAIPEPETYAMLLAGLGLLSFVARRKHKMAN